MRRVICLVAAFVFTAALAHAQTPEEISKSYFSLLKAQKWDEVAALFDPSALRDFRDMMLFLLEMPDELAPKVLGQFFGPGSTKATVKAMSDTVFFSSFLRGVMAQAGEMGRLDFTEVEVLGSIPEGERVRHVVTRAHIGLGEVTLEEMEVISFSKTDAGWRILLQGRMKGMAHQIKRALTRGRD